MDFIAFVDGGGRFAAAVAASVAVFFLGCTNTETPRPKCHRHESVHRYAHDLTCECGECTFSTTHKHTHTRTYIEMYILSFDSYAKRIIIWLYAQSDASYTTDFGACRLCFGCWYSMRGWLLLMYIPDTYLIMHCRHFWCCCCSCPLSVLCRRRSSLFWLVVAMHHRRCRDHDLLIGGHNRVRFFFSVCVCVHSRFGSIRFPSTWPVFLCLVVWFGVHTQYTNRHENQTHTHTHICRVLLHRQQQRQQHQPQQNWMCVIIYIMCTVNIDVEQHTEWFCVW